jgi:L-alanine-DL-glutamate epimerase-like enolase superfamily enzyme
VSHAHGTFIVVKVETNNGLYGYGECPHWQRGYFGVRETIDYIGERLIGANPFDVKKIVEEHFNGGSSRHISQEVYQERSLPVGPIVWAMSGIEMALLDIIGKQSGLPVHSLLRW